MREDQGACGALYRFQELTRPAARTQTSRLPPGILDQQFCACPVAGVPSVLVLVVAEPVYGALWRFSRKAVRRHDQ